MNRDVVLYAIKDLKTVINEIESRAAIYEEDYIKLEKELNSFLSNLSAYRFRNIKSNNNLLSGFQYAFNLMKHNKKLVTVKNVQRGGISLPMTLPFTIPCSTIYWLDISSIKPDKQFIKQYNNYLKELNNKRIIETIEELEKII